ncbi:MAG: hypothetical protein K6G54_07785 [Oscillospiraceae bacterium]|nr:hypothetical protein [Oscillospiraceae bacterium]
MKELLKKLLLCCVLLACLCGFGYLVWVHRRVIKAMLTGEPMPEVPENCPAHRFCKKEAAET